MTGLVSIALHLAIIENITKKNLKKFLISSTRFIGINYAWPKSSQIQHIIHFWGFFVSFWLISNYASGKEYLVKQK